MKIIKRNGNDSYNTYNDGKYASKTKDVNGNRKDSPYKDWEYVLVGYETHPAKSGFEKAVLINSSIDKPKKFQWSSNSFEDKYIFAALILNVKDILSQSYPLFPASNTMYIDCANLGSVNMPVDLKRENTNMSKRLSYKPNIVVSPNPVNNSTSIKIEDFESPSYLISIYNYMGQYILKNKFTENNNLGVISLASLTDTEYLTHGIYFIKIDDGIKVRTINFIKE